MARLLGSRFKFEIFLLAFGGCGYSRHHQFYSVASFELRTINLAVLAASVHNAPEVLVILKFKEKLQSSAFLKFSV